MVELQRFCQETTNPMDPWDAPHFAESLGNIYEACPFGGKTRSESVVRGCLRFIPKSHYLLPPNPELSHQPFGVSKEKIRDSVQKNCVIWSKAWFPPESQ